MRICTERCCNQRLLPSVARPDLGISCSVPPPLGASPLGLGRCSRLGDVTYTRSCMNAPLGNSLALVLSYREVPLWLSPHLEPIISCQTLHKHSGWNILYLSLGIFEKIFFELGIHGLFVKVSGAVGGEHLSLYKKSIKVHVQTVPPYSATVANVADFFRAGL